jgi:hypothetical protein
MKHTRATPFASSVRIGMTIVAVRKSGWIGMAATRWFDRDAAIHSYGACGWSPSRAGALAKSLDRG